MDALICRKFVNFSAGVKFGDVVSSMESDPGFLSGPRRYVRGAEKVITTCSLPTYSFTEMLIFLS